MPSMPRTVLFANSIVFLCIPVGFIREFAADYTSDTPAPARAAVDSPPGCPCWYSSPLTLAATDALYRAWVTNIGGFYGYQELVFRHKSMETNTTYGS